VPPVTGADGEAEGLTDLFMFSLSSFVGTRAAFLAVMLGSLVSYALVIRKNP
jgi:hypothetical protein